jgi:hypothetical protein
LEEVEAVHEALLRLAVFVTIARELDQNERWRSRVYVLLESAMAPLDACLIHIEKALKEMSAHRRLRTAGVGPNKTKQAPQTEGT